MRCCSFSVALFTFSLKEYFCARSGNQQKQTKVKSPRKSTVCIYSMTVRNNSGNTKATVSADRQSSLKCTDTVFRKQRQHTAIIHNTPHKL